MTTMSTLVMTGLVLLVLGVYWFPSIVARIQRHPDLVRIVVVNALLGWTVVGWAWAVIRLVNGRLSHRFQPQAVYVSGTFRKRP
jgi:hypothetical protein